MTLLNQLSEALSTDERLVIDGKLAKNKIVELALNLEPTLLKLLLTNKELKSHFFTEVEDMLIFDKIAFQRFVNNKSFLPDSFTQFKNKIGLSVEDHYLAETNDVVLSWPYKDCILEGGQTKDDQKRSEVFWNETLAPEQVDTLLAPKALSHFKKYDANGEHTNFELNSDSDNLIIKGNNLLALHSLKVKFRKQVKLIYIDPPYNTGADSFKYNDSFNHSTWLTFMKNRLQISSELLNDEGVIFVQCDDNEQAYLKVLMDEVFGRESFVKTIHVQMSNVQGQKVKAAQDGNIVKNGEYIHVYSKSNKKNIGVAPLYQVCDYDTHYSFYLKKSDNAYIETSLADELVKNKDILEELKALDLLSNKDVLTKKNLAKAYALSQKSKLFIHKNSDFICSDDKTDGINIPDVVKENLKPGVVSKWVSEKTNKEYLLTINSNNKIRQRPKLAHKIQTPDDFINDLSITTIRGDWWTNYHLDLGNVNKEGAVEFPNGKKPERLIKDIIKFTTNANDLVLDFHLGSGTTAAVAHKMSRRYIGIEQMGYIDNLSVQRLKNVITGEQTAVSKQLGWQGGGSFVYCELADLASKYSESIEQAKSSKELITIWDKLKDNSNLSYKVNPKEFDKNIEFFNELSFEDQQRFLIEAIDKNQLYVNYTDIDDETNNISEQDKKLNKQFYGA
jgi:adenine-specific DNA-methyltransferase